MAMRKEAYQKVLIVAVVFVVKTADKVGICLLGGHLEVPGYFGCLLF